MLDAAGQPEPHQVNVVIEWDGQQYRARCPDLDLVATGKTANEARDAMWMMIEEYLALTQSETWEDYLENFVNMPEADDATWAPENPVIN